MVSRVITRAILSLQKKATLREARWKRICAGEQAERAQRDALAAFVERYLKLRDELASETADWNRDDRRRYMYAVLQVMRRQRT
jgi:hypothetical protein